MNKQWRVSIELADGIELTLPPTTEEDAYKVLEALREVYDGIDVGLVEVS